MEYYGNAYRKMGTHTENMKILPSVTIKKFRPGEEAELFFRFMNNPYFPTHRRFIIRAFPELRSTLREQRNEKEAVQNFIRFFYKKNAKNISAANVKSGKRLARNSKKALRALSEIMEYKWKDKTRYYATPTILPFSPFKDNRFYFSILGIITEKNEDDALRTAIHEISHFIFFNILREIESEKKIRLGCDAMHYLKEGLTAVLLNKEPLRHILKLKNYKGNPEIRELYIKPPRGKTVGFSKYIDNICAVSKTKHQPFANAIRELVVIAHHNEPVFTRKRTLWNRYDKYIFNNPKLLSRYQRPIKVKESGSI